MWETEMGTEGHRDQDWFGYCPKLDQFTYYGQEECLEKGYYSGDLHTVLRVVMRTAGYIQPELEHFLSPCRGTKPIF